MATPSVPQTSMVGTRWGRMWRKRMRARLGADRPFRLDEFALGQRARLGVGDARDLRPVHHGDDQRHDPQARPEDRGEHDGEEQRRKGHHQVGEAHQRAADEAAEEPGGDPDHRPDHHRDAVGDDADDQRGPRAVEEPRQEVATEQVGAEQVGRVRRQRRAFKREAVEELLVRREGREPRREDRGDHHQEDRRPARTAPAAALARPASTRPSFAAGPGVMAAPSGAVARVIDGVRFRDGRRAGRWRALLDRAEPMRAAHRVKAASPASTKPRPLRMADVRPERKPRSGVAMHSRSGFPPS